MQRSVFINEIKSRLCATPVVALLGPRQCGKTTLAKEYLACSDRVSTYFDLEDPVDWMRLQEPQLALQECQGLVVIDEIQLRPHLFPLLRVLVDQRKTLRFLILGSASRDLIQQSSETLAGRISYIECTPFNMSEVKESRLLMQRGGFPRSYLAQDAGASLQWRRDYIKTFLERDIPALGFRVSAQAMRRFWLMLSHYHGQIFNASELGQSLGVAHTTVRHYLDILTGTFMIRELLPWYENIGKRHVKSSKIYFRDSGIYLALLGIENEQQLHVCPKLGAAWEGFALEQVVTAHQASSEEVFFWAVHSQAELDLLLTVNGKRVGIEFKYQDAPVLSKSLVMAQELLRLDSINVIYPGNKRYPLHTGINVVGLEQYIAGCLV